MRLCVLFLVVVSCVCGNEISAHRDEKTALTVVESSQDDSIGEPRAIIDEIEKLIECLRATIKEGVPDSWIPSLDPFKFPLIPLFFNINGTLDAKMLLRKLRFEGLGDFDLVEKRFSTIVLLSTLRLKFQFDSLRFSSRYHGSLKLLNLIDLYGKGNINVDIRDLSIDFTLTLRAPALLPMKITAFNSDVRLPSVQVNITGLLNDERMSGLLSRQLADIATTALERANDDFNKILLKTLQTIIDDMINPAIAKLTIADLIRLITGGSSICPALFEAGIDELVNIVQKNMVNLMIDHKFIDTSDKYYKYNTN